MRSRTAAESLLSFALDIGTEWYHTLVGGTARYHIARRAIMLKPRILVTGATGKTGSVVVAALLQAGYPVRPGGAPPYGHFARLKAQGAKTAVADMSDVDHVADALKDVQRA